MVARREVLRQVPEAVLTDALDQPGHKRREIAWITREQVLFSLPDSDFVDIGPDGRFLVRKEMPGQQVKFRVVVNWLSELKK